MTRLRRDEGRLSASIEGTCTVISFPSGNPAQAKVLGALHVGTEPFGVLVTPNGSKAYVANRNSGDVTVIGITPSAGRTSRRRSTSIATSS